MTLTQAIEKSKISKSAIAKYAGISRTRLEAIIFKPYRSKLEELWKIADGIGIDFIVAQAGFDFHIKRRR